MGPGGGDFPREKGGVGGGGGHLPGGGEGEDGGAVSFERGLLGEAIAKEARHKAVVFGERDDAVANVAGRKNAEFAAKASAGTTVIGNGNDSGKFVDDDDGRSGFRFARVRRVQNV